MSGIIPKTNKIINGDFSIAQRGNSFTVNYSSLINAYTADRFNYQIIGTPSSNPSHAVIQNTLSSSDAPYKAGLLYSGKITATTIGSYGSASGSYYRYHIEGYDIADLKQKMINISFWFKASRAVTFAIFLNNAGNDRSYVKQLTIASPNTWQEFSFAVDLRAGTSSGVWDYTNSRGLSIGIAPILGAGNSWSSGVDSSWVSSLQFCTSSVLANNLFQANGDYFEITGLRLTEGAEKQPYRKAGGTYQAELAMCQRYYEKSYAQGTNPASVTTAGVVSSYASATTDFYRGDVVFMVPKRISTWTPTIYSPADGALNNIRDFTAGANSAQTSTSFASNRTDRGYTSNPTGLTIGRAYGWHWAADAEL